MLSIIVPCYNCENTIESCVESILDALRFSKITEYEILLINDGSTDGTKRKLDVLSENDEKVKVYYQQNSGVSSARNKGIDNSVGDYINFIDADDTINEKFYFSFVENFDENIDIFVCGINNNISPKLHGGGERISKSGYIEKILSDLNVYGYSCNKIYKRKILDNNNIRFTEGIYFMEDKYFNLEVAINVEEVYYTKENLYNYFEPTTSLSGNSFKKATGMKVWDNLISDARFEKYRERFINEKFHWMIWLLGQMYAEKAEGREEILRELKGNKDIIERSLPKKTVKYIQYKLLLLSPTLVGFIVRRKNRV